MVGSRNAAPIATAAGSAAARPTIRPSTPMAVKPTTRGSGFKARSRRRLVPPRSRRSRRRARQGRCADPQLRRERQPVGECRNCDLLHVVGLHEVASVQGRASATELHQGERSARRGTNGQLGRVPRRMHERNRIGGDRLRKVDLFNQSPGARAASRGRKPARAPPVRVGRLARASSSSLSSSGSR